MLTESNMHGLTEVISLADPNKSYTPSVLSFWKNAHARNRKVKRVLQKVPKAKCVSELANPGLAGEASNSREKTSLYQIQPLCDGQDYQP